MLKLTLWQKLRFWLWRSRRSVIITLFCLAATALMWCFNSLLGIESALLPVLTMAQLGASALLVIVVIICTD